MIITIIIIAIVLDCCYGYHSQYLYMNSIYPLVNIHIAVENHHVVWENSLSISMAVFNDRLLVYQRMYIYIYIYMYISTYLQRGASVVMFVGLKAPATIGISTMNHSEIVVISPT